jgi:hypothetical protein
MKTIIAGSRGITDYRYLLKCLLEVDWEITSVISGTARGVDALGEKFALEAGIPLMRFHANWKLYGGAAGYIRNEEMAENAEACVILWDGQSSGTKHMIDEAKKAGLKLALFVNGERL